MLQSRHSPIGRASGLASAAVKDVVAEFFHLEDRGVRAPGDRPWQVRLDDSLNEWWAYARGADGAIRAIRDAGAGPPPSLELVRADSRDFKFR